MSDRITVLLADDRERARHGLRALLGTCPDVDVVAEARDGGEAVRLAGVWRPDVVLMDLEMPSLDRTDAVRRIKVTWPETAVLVLTMYPDRATEARAAGADGFLVKGGAPAELIARIRAMRRPSPGPTRNG